MGCQYTSTVTSCSVLFTNSFDVTRDVDETADESAYSVKEGKHLYNLT